MNELSIIFHKMGIDTKSVIEAAGTKWNFLKFSPGLVGGHCIGVDPYYLTYRAEQLGYRSKVILAGRHVNDDMGNYVAENIIKLLIKNDVNVKNARVGILGISFKENCPDTRNTRVVDIINELKEYSVEAVAYDPVAEAAAVEHEYGIKLCEKEDLRNLDAVVVAVAHDELKALTEADIASMHKADAAKILVDVKGIFDRKEFLDKGYSYWRL
jgi:UDP-N-acetyl-D-galactosamine dehydrogenase